MNQDVTQWLAEVKSLQQQLMEVRRDRDEAYSSAANWRKLYETEAQQRRTESQMAKTTIASLHAEIEQLKKSLIENLQVVTHDPAGNDQDINQDINDLQTSTELKTQLLRVMAERDQLAHALETEKANHSQTRKSLTTALSDTVDLLTRERAKTKEESPKPEEK